MSSVGSSVRPVSVRSPSCIVTEKAGIFSHHWVARSGVTKIQPATIIQDIKMSIRMPHTEK